MVMSRTHTIQIENLSASFLPLGELRWLVQQLEGAPDSLEVRVKAHSALDVRDSSSARLSVEAPDRPSRPPGPVMREVQSRTAKGRPHEPGDGHP